MNLLMQGAFDPNRPVRSIPTSKNSAVASVFGPEVLSWVDHGSVEMGPVFDLAQTLAMGEATVQSAPPVAVMFISPLGVALLMPTHLNSLSVVTDPPVENSPTMRISPTTCAPEKLTAPLVLEQETVGSCSSQRPKSPAPLFAKRSNPPYTSKSPALGVSGG